MGNAARPTRQTETRHHPLGKTCHHFQFHGLTCDQYDDMRNRAGGSCELCLTPEAETGGRRLIVDHFEDYRVTFRFTRGLLCDKCNAVMSCLDGRKRWGANRKWETRARAYEINSWQQPTPEQWAALKRLRGEG